MSSSSGRYTLFLFISEMFFWGPSVASAAFLPTAFLTTGPSRPAAAAAAAMSTSTTSLFANKNSDRAHIERNLEVMMDNDWRTFRAQLVAQEKAEVAEKRRMAISHHSAPSGINQYYNNHLNNDNRYYHHQDDRLARQGQLSDIFAGAIGSIFHKGHHRHHVRSGSDAYADRNIFAGDTIGNADLPLSLFMGEHVDVVSQCEDPFVSTAELPLLLKPKATIDKHRWAHEIPHVEAGCVLLANEKLGGVFHQTVVLIVQHCEHSGSIGLVINRPMDGDLLKIGSEQQSALDLSLKLAFPTSPVTYGGPVLTEEFSVLHSFGEVEGSSKLCPGVFVGGSEELMNEVRLNRFDPRNALFCKGHAAWSAGQLNREISKGVWYTAAVSSDFILRYAGGKITPEDNPSDLWVDIMTCMEGDFAEVAHIYGGRGDPRMP